MNNVKRRNQRDKANWTVLIKAQLSRVEGPSESPKLNYLFIFPKDQHGSTFHEKSLTPLHVFAVRQSLSQTDRRLLLRNLNSKIAIDLIACARKRACVRPEKLFGATTGRDRCCTDTCTPGRRCVAETSFKNQLKCVWSDNKTGIVETCSWR